ncbi:hypothetical protein VTO42DRAFT_9070 [Malbranchea cinnamomea]
MAADTSPKLSRALVLHGPKALKLEAREIVPPAAHEVQVSIRATTLCGSDLHYYHHGRNGDFVLRSPLVLGHESAGTVIAVGPKVASLQPGDRVALEVGLPCRTCALCVQGRYNICRSLRFRSSAKTFPHLDGTLMDVTNHPASMCHKLPPTITDVQGALLEPLAVCLHAINRSRVPTDEEVSQAKSADQPQTAALVFGAGAIGLLLASALATTTAFTSIVIADIDAARLKIASSLPFSNKIKTHLLPQPTPGEQSSDESVTASIILDTFSIPYGFTRVYECTGVPACVRMAIYASAPGGAVVQIGMGGPSQPAIPLGAAALREVDLIGVFRYDGRAYPEAVKLMGSGELDGVTEKVVTHQVGIDEEEGQRAFRLAASGVDENGATVVKVAVLSGK